MFKLETIKAVGFDLDETLYPTNDQINNCIRDNIAEYIKTKLELQTLSTARLLFDTLYLETASTRKVLTRLNFTNEQITTIAEQATSSINITKWLKPDAKTIKIVEAINTKFITFLITSSTKNSAEQKLTALNLNINWFKYKSFANQNGNKIDGQPFSVMLKMLYKLHAIKPNETIFIGNSKTADIIPSKNEGMQTIAVGSEIPEATTSIPHFNQVENILQLTIATT